MDGLHLTYDEVVDRIPYRNLVIMSKDKLRTAFNGVKREVSDEQFFGGSVRFDG